MSTKKLILVIGSTGAQGMPVVSSLLAPCEDGSPSPYAVRALTRDPKSRQAQALASRGAELFTGRFDDPGDIAAAFEGCYGAFVNTDTFTVGAQKEIYAGIKMFEQAHRYPTMRHFIWSALDYGSKYGNYEPQYKAVHFDAKGAVTDFLRSQPSDPNGDSLTWSVITTGPYMENLSGVLLGPLPERENGAVVFALPVEDGHIPAVSLKDIGWWARYTFDHRSETSSAELKIATEWMTIDQLVETFKRVTGIPAIRKRISIKEYFDHYPHIDSPIVQETQEATIREVFSAMFCCWRDGLLTRDMEWVRRVHPTGDTLESWIRETGWDGSLSQNFSILKNDHANAGAGPTSAA